MIPYRLYVYILLAAFCFNNCNCNHTQNPLEHDPGTSKQNTVSRPSNTSGSSKESGSSSTSGSSKEFGSSSSNNQQKKNVGLVIIKKIGNVKHVLIHKRFDGKLAGPGGAIDPKSGGGWESPEEAGAREAKEESGLDIPQAALKYLGIGGDGVVMLLWETNIDTVPGPVIGGHFDWEVKQPDLSNEDAKDAGGRHMWIDLAALRKHKNDVLSLFFQYAEQELVK